MSRPRLACLAAVLSSLLNGALCANAAPASGDATHGYRHGETFLVTTHHRVSIAVMTRLAAAREALAPGDEPAGEPDRAPVRPDRSSLHANPASPSGATWPARPARTDAARPIAAPFSPQVVGTSFPGATYAGVNPTLLFPPDCMGAVGPAQFVVLVNGRLVSFDKTTGLADGVLNIRPDAFFGGGPPPYTTDPRIRYDRLSSRWFLMINWMNSPDNLVVAVSDSGGVLTPSTQFVFTSIPVDGPSPPVSSTCFADYPTLGIDANAVYLGANNFCGADPGNGCDVYVIRKRSLWDPYAPAVITAFRGVSSATAEGPFTPHGVDNFDPAATEGYVIGVDNWVSGTLSLLRVSDPGGTPAISAPIAITVPATAPPIRVPHLGNVKGVNGTLDAIDDRLMSAVMRDHHVWTSHQVGVDNTGSSTGLVTRDGSRWYEIDVPPGGGAPTLLQAGTVFAPSVTNLGDQRSYWMSSLMVSGQGHAAIGFSTAGSAEHINAATAGRLAGDPPGTMQAVQMLTNSTFGYNPSKDVGGPIGRRWGDYSYTCVDPLDDQTMWTVQEYCDQAASYAVRVAKLVAPPPAVPASCPDVSAGTNPVTVTLTGVSNGASGFFDPGTDPPGGLPFHHLAVSVRPASPGGTPPVVIAATVVNPTTITLVLDAHAARVNAPGESDTVTVTNPDGQSASGAVLRVVAPAAIGPSAPAAFGITAVRPNPSSGALRVGYTLARAARVRLSVLDLQGREVAVLADGVETAGAHEARWDPGADPGRVPPGIYLACLRADGHVHVRRLARIR